MKNWNKIFEALPDEEQDKLALLRLVECTNGVIDFMKIIRAMPSFGIVEFGVDDVIRSGLIKEYLIAKMELNL